MPTAEQDQSSALVLDALILAMALEEAPDLHQEREIVARWLAARQARRARAVTPMRTENPPSIP